MKSLELFLEEALQIANASDRLSIANSFQSSDLYKKSEKYPYPLKKWIYEIGQAYKNNNVQTSRDNVKKIYQILVSDYQALVDHILDMTSKKTTAERVVDDNHDSKEPQLKELTNDENVDKMITSLFSKLVVQFNDLDKWKTVLTD